jgi:hypothetical protein
VEGSWRQASPPAGSRTLAGSDLTLPADGTPQHACAA